MKSTLQKFNLVSDWIQMNKLWESLNAEMELDLFIMMVIMDLTVAALAGWCCGEVKNLVILFSCGICDQEELHYTSVLYKGFLVKPVFGIIREDVTK